MAALAPLVKKRKGAPLAPSMQPAYSEGTWTPTLSDGTNNATTSLIRGRYILIGNQCFAEFELICTAIGSATGSIRISLPFARRVGGTSSSGPVSYITYIVATKMGAHVALRCDTTNDYCFVIASSEASGGASIAFADLLSGGNTTIRGSIVYPVDAQSYP